MALKTANDVDKKLQDAVEQMNRIFKNLQDRVSALEESKGKPRKETTND